MWDSTSKSAEGVLVGRLHHLGNFDECLSATAPFDTQFCLVTIKLDSYNVSSPTTSNPFEESVLQRIEMYVSCQVVFALEIAQKHSIHRSETLENLVD